MQRRGFSVACASSADQAISASAMTDVTDLVLQLPEAGTYAFRFDVLTSSSSAATLTAACTCTQATAFKIGALVPITTTTFTAITANAINTATSGAARTATATDFPTTFAGTVTVSGPGRLQFRMATSVSTLTVRSGSGGVAVQV